MNFIPPTRVTTGPVHVIGASGRSGQALCRSLLADGVPIVPVVRNVGRWKATQIWLAVRKVMDQLRGCSAK